MSSSNSLDNLLFADMTIHWSEQEQQNSAHEIIENGLEVFNWSNSAESNKCTEGDKVTNLPSLDFNCRQQSLSVSSDYILNIRVV